MSDYMVRATAANQQIRAFAVYTKDMVEEARVRHNTSPVATAALGRLLSGTVMMGAMMKEEGGQLTVKVQGAGALKAVTANADTKGNVRGFVAQPQAVVPAKNGKLDVGGALVPGVLTVTKDMGLKEPYTGTIELMTGEIGDDLTYYFASSEQTPSSVGLGVLMDKENFVRQAGGFIIQLMPFTEEETIERLEKKLSTVTSVTGMLEDGKMPEDILEELLGEFGLEITEKMPVRFQCSCSKEMIKNALITLPEADLQEMIDGEEPIEVNCHFCNTNYTFSVNELKTFLTQRERMGTKERT